MYVRVHSSGVCLFKCRWEIVVVFVFGPRRGRLVFFFKLRKQDEEERGVPNFAAEKKKRHKSRRQALWVKGSEETQEAAKSGPLCWLGG